MVLTLHQYSKEKNQRYAWEKALGRQQIFGSHTFWFSHRLLNCYMNIYGLKRFSIGNSSKLAISHLFWRFHTFFHTFFNSCHHHIIRLLNCNKNIYGLCKFSIENSSKLAISHLFWRFRGASQLKFLPITFYLLPITYYLLPITYYLLTIT